MEVDTVLLRNAPGSTADVFASELASADAADQTPLGLPAPEASDTWWVDASTREYVRAEDGKRFVPGIGRILIWSDKDVQHRRDDDVEFDPDVVRLENAIIRLLYQGSLERSEFADCLVVVRNEVRQVADGTIVWEPDYPVGSPFNSDFAELLDDLCVCARHPSAAGEHVEEVDFLTGRIGSLAVRSVLSVYANGKEAALPEFTAEPCESPEAAMVKARAWAIAEATEYTAESMRVALSFAGCIKDWPLDQSMCELADSAESAAHPLFLGKAPEEDALTAFFARRIRDTECDDDDIPRPSTGSLAEIQERMEITKAEPEGND